MPVKTHLVGYGISLRPIQEADLEQLRRWRNDPEIARHMVCREYISQEQQRAWFQSIGCKTEQQHFVIQYKDTPIGAANIKALDSHDIATARLVEPGLYIGDQTYRGNIIAFAPTLLLNDYCFYDLGVKALKAIVKSDNTAALNYNAKLGYSTDKAGDKMHTIVLTQNAYENASKQFKHFFSRNGSTDD